MLEAGLWRWHLNLALILCTRGVHKSWAPGCPGWLNLVWWHPIFCGSPVWKLPHVTVLVPRFVEHLWIAGLSSLSAWWIDGYLDASMARTFLKTLKFGSFLCPPDRRGPIFHLLAQSSRLSLPFVSSGPRLTTQDTPQRCLVRNLIVYIPYFVGPWSEAVSNYSDCWCSFAYFHRIIL
jgi:hypothetical protein